MKQAMLAATYAIGFAIAWAIAGTVAAYLTTWGGTAPPILKGLYLGATLGFFGGYLFSLSQPGVIAMRAVFAPQIVGLVSLASLILVGVGVGGLEALGLSIHSGQRINTILLTLGWGAVHGLAGWGVRALRAKR